MRDYPTLKALRRGETVDIGGILLKMDVGENGKEKEIKPGDLYVAERNTGPHLLTARVVDTEAGCIHPVDFGIYSFDLWECVRVREA